MNYLTLRLMIVIIMLGISIIIGFSETYYHRGGRVNNGLELANLEVEFENKFWSFSLGDYMFSGLEQIVMIIFAIIGLCSLEDILMCNTKEIKEVMK